MTHLTRAFLVLSSLIVIAGCGGDDAADGADAPEPIDAAIDAIDAPSRCGADFFFTGEYADWDSTAAAFDGVEFATWTVRSEPSRTAMTAPNGRLELCIAAGALSVIDVTHNDYLSGVFMADPAVFQSPGQPFFQIKGLRTEIAPIFYQSLGLTFDPNLGHVLVQKQGTAIPLTLTVGGEVITTAFAADDGNDTSWSAGSTGGLVLFANLDAPGLGILSASSTFVGPTELELQAGKLTLVTIR